MDRSGLSGGIGVVTAEKQVGHSRFQNCSRYCFPLRQFGENS